VSTDDELEKFIRSKCQAFLKMSQGNKIISTKYKDVGALIFDLA
jgi:hypothetical protein